MALSHVQTDTPMALGRAAGGYTRRARESQLARLQLPNNVRPQLEQYRKLLDNIAQSEVTERLAGLRLRDEMVAVLLSRILGDTYNRWRDRTKASGIEALPLDLGILGEI